jgi:hypothetical protein
MVGYAEQVKRLNIDTSVQQERLVAQQQAAIANPERAAAVAVVEANAPWDMPEPERNSRSFMEYQLKTVADNVGEKAWIFSRDSYAADAAALLVNPIRTIFGQSKAGTVLGLDRFGYYNFTVEFNKLPLQQKEAMWDTVIARLKEAAGGNDLLFFGLVHPLIYPSQIGSGVGTMPQIDAVFDIIDFGSTVGAFKLARLLKNKLAYRSRALTVHGNPAEAGRATVKGIKAGDPDAIADGSPIPTPEGTPGLSPPTQLNIVAELERTGRLAPGEDVVARGVPLTHAEQTTAVGRRKEALVATGAEILSTDVNPEGVKFTYELRQPDFTVSVTDLSARKEEGKRMLEGLLNEQKLLIAGSEPGQNAERLAELRGQINDLRRWDEQLTQSIAGGATKADLEVTKPVTIEKTMLFTEDDVGKLNFRDVNVGFYTHFLGTPESRVGKLFEGLVSYATNMRQQQRRLFGYFDKEVKKLRRDFMFHGKQADELNDLLLTGDRLQKRFKDQELRDGVTVDGVGFVSFNPKQIEAYNKVRDLYDDLYVLADRMKRDELVFGGYEMFFGALVDDTGTIQKQIKIFGKTNDVKFTPPINGYDSRVASVIDLRVSSGTSKGLPVDLNSLPDLDARLNKKQYGFVQLNTPVRQGDGREYGYALVEVDMMGDIPSVRGAHLPDNPLDYRRGYVPKLAQENVRWIVEKPKKTFRDGVEISDSRIMRGFETEAEADIYRQQRIAAGKDPGEKQQITPSWRNDVRNKEKVEFMDNALFKGAFVGHRHESSTFRIGLDGKEATRVSSFDALQRYADYVASYTPMHLYKQATIKRFINEAKGFLSIVGKWDSPLNGSGDEWARLKAMQDWMKSSFAVPTTEEHMFAKFTDKMLGFLEKAIYNIPEGKQRKGTNTLKAMHHWISTSRSAEDPVSFVKGITFDLLLGMFNPAQLFIQSAGIFIPTTIRPLDAMKAIPEFMFLRSAIHANDFKSAARAASKIGLNGRKMETMLHALHRSGIPDSILENADFGHYAGTHGAWYSQSVINTVREKGRFFYNHGELNNRIMPFVMAFNSKAKEHGWDLTKKLNDAQLNEVVQESLRLNTNMTAANKAKWQDGILGMPTQFWQQTHKYYENLFYGLVGSDSSLGRKLGTKKENQWTRAESMTALGMNLVMFGAAGYGIDEWTESFDRYLVSEDGLNLDPEKDRSIIAAMRGGFYELATLKGLGFEVDVTDRMGPASGSSIIYEKLIKPMGEAAAEGKLGEALGVAFLGPTNTTMTRTLEAGKKFVNLMASDAEFMTWDMNTLAATLTGMAGVSTSITNLERALAWSAANDILNNRNLPLSIIENGTEIPTSLVLIKAAGFDPLAKEKMEKLLRQKTASEKDKASMAQNIADEYRRLFLSRDEGTLGSPVQMEIIQRRIALRKAKIAEQFGQQTLDDIMRRTIKRLDEEKWGTSNDYRKYLFERLLEATPESEAEKSLRADWELQELARIKGNENAD